MSLTNTESTKTTGIYTKYRLQVERQAEIDRILDRVRESLENDRPFDDDADPEGLLNRLGLETSSKRRKPRVKK